MTQLTRHECPTTQQRGFTLIEMMAAMTLIGMIAGLMLPNFQRWHDSTQQRVNAGAIGIQLQKLYVRAALMGQEFELTTKHGRWPASTPIADRLAYCQPKHTAYPCQWLLQCHPHRVSGP